MTSHNMSLNMKHDGRAIFEVGGVNAEVDNLSELKWKRIHLLAALEQTGTDQNFVREQDFDPHPVS